MILFQRTQKRTHTHTGFPRSGSRLPGFPSPGNPIIAATHTHTTTNTNILFCAFVIKFKMTENSSSSSAANSSDDSNAEVILGTYKRMAAECQQIAAKIQELNMERDEHRLVVDTLTKLEPERKAFRLIGGVLVERTVVEVLPAVQQHYEGVS
jgi:prefoldin subunit 2